MLQVTDWAVQRCTNANTQTAGFSFRYAGLQETLKPTTTQLRACARGWPAARSYLVYSCLQSRCGPHLSHGTRINIKQALAKPWFSFDVTTTRVSACLGSGRVQMSRLRFSMRESLTSNTVRVSGCWVAGSLRNDLKQRHLHIGLGVLIIS